jgi:hypothetical protein
MLDWDRITPERRDIPEQDSTTEPGRDVPACPGKNGACPGNAIPLEANNGEAFGGVVPAVPVVPAKNQGKGKEFEESGAGGVVAANHFASEIQAKGVERQPINHVAVVLLLAYSEKVQASLEEILAALTSLRTLPPGEQVRTWWQACLSEKLKPWRLIHLPTSGEGMECTGCSNINLVSDRVPGSRGMFHWSCKQGYLIHETGRYTERILIAPPECKSFERWRPGQGCL